MLISMWTNAVMFRVNVQNVLRRLQRRPSVACTIHWWHCQSLPGPDGPIPPQHAGAALPRPWSSGGCTHTLVGSPTPRSRRGSDPGKTRYWTSLIVSGLQAVRGRPLPEQRSMLPIASFLLSTVLTPLNFSFYSETFAVYLLLHRASAVLLILLSCAYLLLKMAF